MGKIKFENYIYFPDKVVKFEELNDDEKREFYNQMIKILQEQTNVECKKNEDGNVNKRLEVGENIPKTK
ncbi:hypothetical protein [Anaerosporobacter sp.]|uniref:hypothetical protein n=1 Tax=Anaerosporobacter sp. TaxID=1872529 RepID=UPI00286F4994|nr:hypothetical protein [Anaerosporobacter sp.]